MTRTAKGEHSREHILRTAVGLFAEKGYTDTTMRDIAAPYMNDTLLQSSGSSFIKASMERRPSLPRSWLMPEPAPYWGARSVDIGRFATYPDLQAALVPLMRRK